MESQHAFHAWGPVRSLPLSESRRAQMVAAQAARAQRLELRERTIRELCDRASKESGLSDRGYWEMVYDFELAPTTNGRTVLLELGVMAVPPQDLRSPVELHEALWTVMEALASRGIYLMNTDHLTDSQLYERLFYKILDEPTQTLPPRSGASEYIDVLHPWDIEAGGHGADLCQRLVEGEVEVREVVRETRAPVQSTSPADRDRFLPRPPEPVMPEEE